MNKKVILTESQYKIIKQFLLESSFDVLARKEILKGDIVTINTNGQKINFKVIQNDNGQIYMDVNDTDSEYFERRIFVDPNSFDKGSLVAKLATDAQKNEKPMKINTWSKFVFKNVDQIDVSRGGKFIDGTNFDPNEELFKERKEDFLKTLSSLDKGDVLVLTTGKLNLELIFGYRIRDAIRFGLSDSMKEKIGNNNLVSVVINTDEKEINVDDKGNILITAVESENIDGDINRKENKLNVKKWTITAEEEEDKKEEEEEEFDSETFIKMLTGDTQLRMAYYKQPTKWQSFWAALKGEKPKTTGFEAIQDILSTYTNRKVSEKLGQSFLKNGSISFEPVDNISILYTESGKNEYFDLNRGTIYRDEYSVRRVGVDGESGDDTEGEFQYNLRLVNKKIDFEIIVKDNTNEPNVFICDVRKLYKEKSKNKWVTKRSQPEKDVKIRFLDSSGYKSEKVDKK